MLKHVIVAADWCWRSASGRSGIEAVVGGAMAEPFHEVGRPTKRKAATTFITVDNSGALQRK